ncbi:GPI mannosyltransferase 2-like isoform X1 [Vespa velutina]|uniref:GPI mannosyltransferase 2-like isoform X1 n=1 Tax=Vespa velutina TaxID=202808 RepID=UPI001FB43EE3|nr:GPI mannosyltransferase 2-like isoform X1 [Vespa velutina]XP_047355288.1 GPI mannosyltransferase 2-like isoform X1 [Vespa velutina]XP_047355289.1 GPI mannosyltransferase 2-like isoform X1 [Vespa velutina]XP_047355290.1 GPI mannosyltransferase 2-like isoform X1 [Vespa velutina]
MYVVKKKIFWFAIISRALILILQFIFNIICPDHNADAFRSPHDIHEYVSNYDIMIKFIFGGLIRWDGEYFIHIAKYGYTYENMLAFYPLYPATIRITAIIIRKIFFVLNVHSSLIVAAILINYVCFIKSVSIFFDLSKIVLKNTNIAYKAAILYCISPASIFFSAAYTESMFAYFTFYSMLKSVQNNIYTIFPLGLSTLIRSNGIINIGFFIYFRFKSMFNALTVEISSKDKISIIKLCNLVIKKKFIQSMFLLLIIVILTLLPFIFLQIYNYVIFCKITLNAPILPTHIVDYATKNNLVLQYNATSSTWCHAKIPMAYSYIQEKYWNVSFLNYYKLKQIPNFILAFPILYIMMKCITEFYSEHKMHFFSLGLIDIKYEKNTSEKKYPAEMFVFVIHGLFLTVFCICFVHIQVSTRLLCSASPLVYWYCALSLSYVPQFENLSDSICKNEENLISKWKMLFSFKQKYTLRDKLILFYFLGYTIIGCFMFVNFLPWT